MAAKPTIANARWDTDGTNMTAPSSGQRDTGIVASAAAVSSYINYLLNQAYLWFQYLSAGALSGAHTIDNTLGVTGLITATAGVTAAANQHFSASGTGRHKHGARSDPHSHALFACATATTHERTSNYLKNTSGALASFFADVPVGVGKRITAVSIYIQTSGTAGARGFTMNKQTIGAEDATPEGTSPGSASSSTTASYITLSDATFTTTLVATSSYNLSLSLRNDDKVLGCLITYDDL